MMRLHDYWRSSASYRLRIALSLLDEVWETRSVDILKGEQNSAAHLAVHPQGLVPALEIDGTVMTQSLAIIEYLDETRNAGFLPGDARERARVRALAHAIAMDIHPVCNTRVVGHAVAASEGRITREAWMQAFIAPGLRAFETMLDSPSTGRFCHGDKVSLADICLVPQVYNAQRWNVSLERMPRIRQIHAALEDIPAFARAHPSLAPGAATV